MLEGRRAERALTDLKRTAPSLLALAQSEASFQRFDSALEKLDAAIAIDRDLRPAYWQRVWVLIGQQKWEAAAAALRRAAEHESAKARQAAELQQHLQAL